MEFIMKKIFLSLFVLLINAQMSYSVELPSVMKQTMAHDPISMPGLLNLIISMVIVIALIYATGWIYTKLNLINRDKLKKLTSKTTDTPRFSVLQTMPLGQQRHLYTIEMNGKILLIGSTPSHINLLKEFDKVDDFDITINATVDSQNSDIKAENKVESKSSLNFDELYRKYKK